MPDLTSTSANPTRIKFVLLFAFCAFFGQFATANHDSAAMHSAAPATAEHATEAHETEGAAHHEEVEKPIGEQISGMILGHIGDNHDWDAFGHHIVFPLPVILYTKSRGFEFFMSSKFEHGHKEYNGYKLINSGAKITWADANNTETIYDFSLTKVALTLILGSILIIVIFISVAKAYVKRAGKAPRGFQNLIESLIVFMRDSVIKSSVGPRYKQFMPLLLTIFWFIFIVNLLGQIPFFPGGANATGNIAIPLVLALVIFLYVVVNGNKYFWKHIFLPDVPYALYILIVPIEILGFFLRPFVLMLRLFANITAGHIIILGFFSLIFIFGSMQSWIGYAVSPASVAFTIFMGMLELLVCFLQAFVFTLLSSLYIGMAIEEHGHHDHADAHSH